MSTCLFVFCFIEVNLLIKGFSFFEKSIQNCEFLIPAVYYDFVYSVDLVCGPKHQFPSVKTIAEWVDIVGSKKA